MIEDCTAVILAGGDSSRMGRDKASIRLGNQTLLQSVGETMRELFPEVIVSVRHPRTESDLPQVCDAVVDGGPLAGFVAALEWASTPWIFVVACDMPFLEPEMIEFLAQQRGNSQAVVPMVGGQPQPFAAFYARDCAGAAREILAGEGKHSMRALLERLDVSYVDESKLCKTDPKLRGFFDLDTPEDLAVVLNEEI